MASCGRRVDNELTMIPTMILLGFAAGRWWKVTVPLGAVTWPLILIAADVELDGWAIAGVAFFGVANAAIGAGLYLAVVALVRTASRSLQRP
jgi:hypothetical protein